jgi:D-alanyl-D-alanine carboxypeptidase
MANFPYRLYGGATRPDAITGLDPRFSAALSSLYAAAPPEVQAQLGLTSGYRSIERQRQLWEASDKSGHWVARPGHSMHNLRLAADLYGFGTGGGNVSGEARDWVHQAAPGFGLSFPMSYEPWHVQLAGATEQGQTPTQPGTPGIFEAAQKYLRTSWGRCSNHRFRCRRSRTRR